MTPTPDPLRDAAQGFLIAADNAALDALVDAEDGAVVPDWQERLWDAADLFRAALAAQPAPPLDALLSALWQCGVESGMDTDGDDGPEALVAGMGEVGFVAAMVEQVRRLRLAYDECLSEPKS